MGSVSKVFTHIELGIIILFLLPWQHGIKTARKMLDNYRLKVEHQETERKRLEMIEGLSNE